MFSCGTLNKNVSSVPYVITVLPYMLALLITVEDAMFATVSDLTLLNVWPEFNLISNK